jgi:hypothetical protein
MSAFGGWRPHVTDTTGGSIYTSVCSAISSASSTSMPRYRTVLSNFMCPSSNCTTRRFLVPFVRAEGVRLGAEQRTRALESALAEVATLKAA